MSYILIWLAIGWISSLIAIKVFRSGKQVKSKELYAAASGFLFGPIITILMIIDLFKRHSKA